MKHLDLFSGIGGFALAVEEVWPGSEHIFCEIDPYCRALLKKRFEGSEIYGDIRELTADTNRDRLQEPRAELKADGDRQFPETFADTKSGQSRQPQARDRRQDISGRSGEVTTDTESSRLHTEKNNQELERERGNELCVEQSRNMGQIDILTGGFPCQPFSQAGKRRGTEDNRYLWPEMLRVIKVFSPQWVIAENVRGLINISNGVVFEQVCIDLEACGYEVQPFIIPAVAVNAPHRRDRVWIVGNATKEGCGERNGQEAGINTREMGEHRQEGAEIRIDGRTISKCHGWTTDWLEVATELCGVDDGISAELDGLKLSKAGHRVERLKALGNAIVPQVAVEIMRAIRDISR